MRPLICFDWDGTLADSMNLCITEIRETLLEMKLPVPPDDVLMQCNGPTFEDTVDILRVPHERTDEYMHIRQQKELSLVPEVNRLFPGIREMLDTLRPMADLCIVSNGTTEYISLCLRTFRLTDAFAHVITSLPGCTKSDRLRSLLTETQPTLAVMVGDRLGDIRAGANNHLPTIAACYGFGNDEEYGQATARAESVAILQAMLMDFCQRSEAALHS